MNEHDLVRAARLHREHLPHGLFPSLGERFLRRYLRTYLNTPTAVALAIEGEHGMFGFLCGTVDRRAHREHVLRHHAASLVRGGVHSYAVFCLQKKYILSNASGTIVIWNPTIAQYISYY